MLRHEDNLVSRLSGNTLQPLAGISVTVTDNVTGLPASLYSDNGVTPITAPIVTDNDGYFGFYAPDGSYTLTFTGVRVAPFTRQIVLDDPKDNPYATLAGLSAGSGASLVTFTQAGAWAVPRSLQAKGRDSVNILDAGFMADWNGTTGTDNGPKLAALLADNSIRKIVGAPGAYWFGNIVGDTALAVRTAPLIIEWAGAQLFIGETNPASANSATTFIRVQDTGGFQMGGYEFTDTTFSYANASRGIVPVLIQNSGTNVTRGYTLGPFDIKAGQSLVTVFSTNPGIAIAKGINLVGACRGRSVYYGVNLAYSGDQFSGCYTLENVVRSLFVYDVEDVDVVMHCKSTQPSSANLLIHTKGVRPTRNVHVRGTFDVLNGGVLVEALSGVSGQFENITVDVFAKAAGANAGVDTSMVRVGAMDGAGSWVASDTYSVKGLRIRALANYKYDLGTVGVLTAGANVVAINIEGGDVLPWFQGGGYKNAGVHITRGGKTSVGGSGDLATSPVNLDLNKIMPVGPRTIFATMRVTSYVSEGSMAIKEYRIAGFFSSAGTHVPTNFSATLVNSVQVGAYAPTVTVTANWTNYVVSASAGGNASANTVVEFSMLDGSI